MPASPVESTQAERDIDLARRLCLRALREIQRVQKCSDRAAALELIRQAGAGELPPAMLGKMSQSKDKRGLKGPDQFPSLPTLQRWIKREASEGHLTPISSAVAKLEVLPWHAPFFALTDRPQETTIKWAWEQLLKLWRPEWADHTGEPPSYDRALAAYNRRSEDDKIAGRHTGSAYYQRTHTKRRTYEGLAPFTEIHADGWCTHSTSPHHETKEQVTLEIWHFHCAVTKYTTAFAIGYSETTDLILQGLKECVRFGGVPAILMTDSTKAVKGNARVTDAITGLSERLGFAVTHPQRVGKSQTNGIAENYNKKLDAFSKALATYQHPSMDTRTFVRVRRLTNQMVAAHEKGDHALREKLRMQAVREGKGIVFDSYEESVAWHMALADTTNHMPHSELPLVTDPKTGKRRHQTPAEAVQQARDEGWEPMLLTDEQLEDNFRPRVKRKVTREGVTFDWGRYWHPAMKDIYGEEVLVAVDPADGTRVWVEDFEGRILFEAPRSERVPGRGESMLAEAEAKRLRARIRRSEIKIERETQRANTEPHYLEMNDGTNVLEGLTSTRELVEVERAEAPQADPTKTYLARKEAEKQAERKRLDAESDIRLAEILAKNRHTGEDDDTLNFESAAG